MLGLAVVWQLQSTYHLLDWHTLITVQAMQKEFDGVANEPDKSRRWRDGGWRLVGEVGCERMVRRIGICRVVPLPVWLAFLGLATARRVAKGAMHYMSKLRLWLLPFSLIASSAFAQDQPDAGRILQETRPEERVSSQSIPPIQAPLQLKKTLPAVGSDVRVQVTGFSFTGNGIIRNEGILNATGSIIATIATLLAGNQVTIDLTGDGLTRPNDRA
jgi:hypothetical protein